MARRVVKVLQSTHDTVYRRAMKLAESELVEAFDLKQESDEVRRRYGVDPFGQGCLHGASASRTRSASG